VRSRYKRQLIQLNMNKSGLHELEWKTRDPYSLVDDSLVLLYSQFWPMWSKSRQGLGQPVYPLVKRLYPAEWMAEKPFCTADHPS